MSNSGTSTKSDDIGEKFDSALFWGIMFFGRYIRTAHDFLLSERLRNTDRLNNFEIYNLYARPTTYLSISVLIYIFCAAHVLEHRNLPEIVTDFTAVFQNTIISLDTIRLVIMAFPLILLVALFAYALRLSARILRMNAEFQHLYLYCAYTVGTWGVIGLLVFSLSYPLLPWLQKLHYQSAFWFAIVITLVFCTLQLLLLLRYIYAIKCVLSTTWKKSVLCNILAVLITALLTAPLVPLGNLFFDKIVPSPYKRQFDRLLEIASTYAKTPRGSDFDALAEEYLKNQHPNMISDCLHAYKQPDMRDIDLILVVEQTGDVASVVAWPRTNVAQCLASLLQVEQLPRPPFPGFVWQLGIRFPTIGVTEVTSRQELSLNELRSESCFALPVGMLPRLSTNESPLWEVKQNFPNIRKMKNC
ncbi:hypothetical protein [Defluviicoccus vanus]|uniref:Uncharacterized protein n=1 Tax=Defluviicoccus vanus TaxID=111831 RepID=A0A7H1N511_9PROT|nr:hypothetical protein [Defluviicoccus vanus]QNT70797.1 hypothetical protein HQ394_17605 [Defluviicoccus vanus]